MEKHLRASIGERGGLTARRSVNSAHVATGDEDRAVRKVAVSQHSLDELRPSGGRHEIEEEWDGHRSQGQ